MLDNLTLVHMNGRVYDPVVGRFISADPFIGSQLNTQGFNRYSYVKNSPLSLIDPSGFRDKQMRTQLKDFDPGTFYEISQTVAFRNAFFAGGSASGDSGGSTDRGFCNMACRATNTLAGFTGTNGTVIVTGVNSPIQQFGGRIYQWVPGGSVSAGEVGPNGEAVDAKPTHTSGRWETTSRLSIARLMTEPYTKPFDRRLPSFHEYEIGPTYVCARLDANCTPDGVAALTDAEAVPMRPPFGSIEGSYDILGFQPIVHSSPESGVSLNVTRPGHWFHPGVVVHAAFEADGAMWVYTRGVGTGSSGSLNIGIGTILFSKMHADVVSSMRLLTGNGPLGGGN
jgi:RHS repeat-associated protein